MSVQDLRDAIVAAVRENYEDLRPFEIDAAFSDAWEVIEADMTPPDPDAAGDHALHLAQEDR